MNAYKRIPIFGEVNFSPFDEEGEGKEVLLFSLFVRKSEFSNIALFPRIEAGCATTGLPDVIIPGRSTFVIRIKSRSPNLALLQEEEDFLLSAQKAGAFVCIGIGVSGAKEALEKWAHLNARIKPRGYLWA